MMNGPGHLLGEGMRDHCERREQWFNPMGTTATFMCQDAALFGYCHFIEYVLVHVF